MPEKTRLRIFMTGVGGQGTLTATQLLARALLAEGLSVTAGEIHGMAQRGGVVESTLLIGWKSPHIGRGEADVLLGFEAVETARALSYLKPGGLVLSSSETLWPVAVAMGKASAPDLEKLRAEVEACAGRSAYLPTQYLGAQAGAVQSGNIALLGALLAMDAVPLSMGTMEQTIRDNLKASIAEINLTALRLGFDAASRA
ncbi:MAG: indolepyruvate oxidoreductase subunit beta [Desulfovibrionaceae bacterium]